MPIYGDLVPLAILSLLTALLVARSGLRTPLAGAACSCTLMYACALWSLYLPAEPALEDANFTVVLRQRVHAGVFNVAFSWNATSRSWIGLGRYLQGAQHVRQCCSRARGVDVGRFFALSDDGAGATFRPLRVPPSVVCDLVGEPKWLVLGGKRMVYTYTNGCSKTQRIAFASQLLPRYREGTMASRYQSYIFDFRTAEADAVRAPASNARPGLSPQVKPNRTLSTAPNVLLLAYDVRPEAGNPTAKNFLLFEHNRTSYALTLAEPHAVFRVSATSGEMHPSYRTHAPLVAALGLPAGLSYHIGLSGGPIHLKGVGYLVAAHVGLGSFGGYRRTFFYVFRDTPPFQIECSTPIFPFQLSTRSPQLEYCTHIELHNRHVFVSLGVDDCYSVLVKVPLNEIMGRCAKLPPMKHPRTTGKK